MISMKTFCTIGLTFALTLLAGCSQSIPDFTFEAPQRAADKLKALGSVHITSAWLTDICHDAEPGRNGYYIVSGNADIRDKEAAWTCASMMRCPNFRVTLTTGGIRVHDVGAWQHEYSRKNVQQCALLAIEEATDRVSPTPGFARRAAKQANSESWR